jgi:hypothetical protein
MAEAGDAYHVLVRGSRESLWWDHVRSVLASPSERDQIPEAALPVVARREVRTNALSRKEAVAIRDWARSLPGWDEEPGLQWLSHPNQAVVDWRDL